MSEVTKTLTFIGTAVVVLALAWFSRPAPATFDSNELVGDTLYDFDPLEARRLRIVRFNSLSGEPQEFEVAKVGDTWSIPSKNGYPADAENQMAEAATALDGKEILRVASENAADHRLFGVLDPTDPARDVGQEGIGTRVTIEDEEGKVLADLIIGKEDKDAPEHRYVRKAKQDVVLVAEVSPEKLSTSFSDWIEKDLLQLSPWDIQKVRIKDYSFEAVPVFTGGGIRLSPEYDHRSDMTLAYDDSDAQWIAESLLVYDPQKQEYVEEPLAESQELNTETLNDLKNALDDLRIVDVGKKPEGLSADLKASEDFLQTSNKEAVMSLHEHGFVPVGSSDGTVEIASTEGEAIVTMKTGVEYVLRFGEVQVDGDSASAGQPGQAGSADGGNLNRYLFVLARFNEGAIPKPELAEVPPLPEGLTEEAAAAAEASSEDSDSAEAADGEETNTAEGQETEEQSDTDKLLAERKRVEEENQRKLDEYADKITQGKETVQELNERFGDWFYVIPDTEYQRIHLGRNQVVQEKQATDGTADQAGGGTPGAVDAGGFGRPGEAIPGLPDVSGLLDEATERTPDTTAEPAADGPVESGESTEEAPAPVAEEPQLPSEDANGAAAEEEPNS